MDKKTSKKGCLPIYNTPLHSRGACGRVGRMPKTVSASIDTNAVEEEGSRASYELAYHFSSLLGEEELALSTKKLMDLLKKHEGEVFAEEAPKLRDLSYTIVYSFEGKKEKIDSAYFGWVRFTAPSVEIPALQAALSLTPRLARHLIVDLPAAAFAPTKRYVPEGGVSPKGEKEGSKPLVSPEELDKTIDELVV